MLLANNRGGTSFAMVVKMETVVGTRVLAVLLLVLACWQQIVVSGLRVLGESPTTGCWDPESLFGEDCYHQEPLTLQPYPLTKEMLDRSVPYSTSDALLRRAFQRARRSGVLRIIVLGGSVPFGHECTSPTGLTDTDCAWPHRLEQWLQARVHDFEVEVVNQAKPGQGVQHFLHQSLDVVLPMDLDVDLVIVAFGVNDAVIEEFNFNLDNVKMVHEMLIRYVRNDMLRSPALLYFESFISPHRVREAPNQASNMADVHAEVTRPYDIPMVSFRHAVWPDIDRPEVADRIWGEGVHPGWQVHQLMADVVVHYLQRFNARFIEVYGTLSDPSPSEEDLQKYKRGLGCVGRAKTTHIDLRQYVDKGPPSQLESVQGWQFLNTDHGPGFFGYGNSTTPAIARFVLSCAGGFLNLEYLTSYEGMGAVRVVVDTIDIEPPVSTIVTVDGLWESRASVPRVQTIGLPESSTSIQVTIQVLSAEDVISGSGMGEEVNRGDRKFRLLSMQCC